MDYFVVCVCNFVLINTSNENVISCHSLTIELIRIRDPFFLYFGRYYVCLFVCVFILNIYKKGKILAFAKLVRKVVDLARDEW